MTHWELFSGMAWWLSLRKDGIDHVGMWFRVKGYGLHVSTRRRCDALFSERNGFRKALYLFGVRFEVLKP